MSPRKYPVLSGKELIKRLERIGYQKIGQRGSHVKLEGYHDEQRHVLVIPLHKELDRGTLQSIIRKLRPLLSDIEMEKVRKKK